jgi:hypothetical protein
MAALLAWDIMLCESSRPLKNAPLCTAVPGPAGWATSAKHICTVQPQLQSFAGLPHALLVNIHASCCMIPNKACRSPVLPGVRSGNDLLYCLLDSARCCQVSLLNHSYKLCGWGPQSLHFSSWLLLGSRAPHTEHACCSSMLQHFLWHSLHCIQA